MITIYKNKRDIPEGVEYVELNDIFFNQNTALRLDEYARRFVEQIEGSELISKFKIKSKFNGVTLDTDCLSTGCKILLNVYYFPEKVFCMKECGENALEMLYGLEQGMVYSDYPVIPCDMEQIRIRTYWDGESKVMEDYETLKEWWEYEK